MSLTDQEILQRLRQGDKEAFHHLFQKYYDMLCIQAFFYTRDSDKAEDVVQNVFIQFWEQRRYDAVQTSLAAYLKSMVRNSAITIVQKERRSKQKRESYSDLLESIDSKNLVELAELSREMHKAIEELPPQCRALFKAVYLEGKKYSEAAAEAGLSINTVKEQLRRAFRRMREKLKNMRYIFLLL